MNGNNEKERSERLQRTMEVVKVDFNLHNTPSNPLTQLLKGSKMLQISDEWKVLKKKVVKAPNGESESSFNPHNLAQINWTQPVEVFKWTWIFDEWKILKRMYWTLSYYNRGNETNFKGDF